MYKLCKALNRAHLYNAICQISTTVQMYMDTITTCIKLSPSHGYTAAYLKQWNYGTSNHLALVIIALEQESSLDSLALYTREDAFRTHKAGFCSCERNVDTRESLARNVVVSLYCTVLAVARVHVCQQWHVCAMSEETLRECWLRLDFSSNSESDTMSSIKLNDDNIVCDPVVVYSIAYLPLSNSLH